MKRLLLIIALIGLGLSSCKKSDGPGGSTLSEIKVGETNLAEISIDKDTSKDILLSGGNGKFAVAVVDSRILQATIDGTYLKLKGLAYGETTILLRSHDLKKEIKVKVERPDISLAESEVTIQPNAEKDIKISGGGDDATLEVQNDEEAIDYTWDAKTSQLKIKTKSEGEATLTFKVKDSSKPAKTLKVVVKASNDVTKQVGLYATTSSELKPFFPTVFYAHRAGKRVWISSNTNPTSGRDNAKRIYIKPIQNPVKGSKIEAEFEFIYLGTTYEGKTGKHNVIVEEVHTAEGLVTLRAKGFKVVMPYDK